MDQLDFVIGSLLFTLPFANVTVLDVAVILAISFVGDIVLTIFFSARDPQHSMVTSGWRGIRDSRDSSNKRGWRKREELCPGSAKAFRGHFGCAVRPHGALLYAIAKHGSS